MLRRLFLDPTPRLRTPWRFLIFGIAFVILVLGLQLAVQLGFIVYLKLSGQLDNFSDPKQLAALFDKQTEFLAVIAAVPMVLQLTLLVILCRKLLDRRTVASLGLGLPSRNELAWLPAAFVLGMTPILIGTAVLWSLGEYQFGSWSATVMTAPLALALIPMAFQEEIVCRGYLLQNLIDIRRTLFGVVFSSIVFWLLHCLNPSAWSSPWISVNLLGAGVVLSLAYLASGNLWFPTVLHYAWNFTQGILLSLPISGVKAQGLIAVETTGQTPEWLSGGKFGLEGSVMVTAVEVVLAGIFVGAMVIQRHRKPIVEIIDATIVQTPTLPPPSTT